MIQFNKLFSTWRTLSDGNSVGKLNNEQFALAMHFVNKKCATGLDPPAELTPEMIPPSLRPKQNTDDSFLTKDLEDLQTQVNELQREKLYYEHRASEHDAVTRQKRTELSNLELEHDSLFKTLRERELNRSEEQKKLNEYEEKLHKSNSQLVELKKKYETEKREIENFKFQISNMESSVADKDNNLSKIKNDLSLMKSEKSSLEARVQQRRNTFNELNSMLLALENENKKVNFKIEINLF
jgi:chromosome segregation ATPase